jgi:hypothetical protein
MYQSGALFPPRSGAPTLPQAGGYLQAVAELRYLLTNRSRGEEPNANNIPTPLPHPDATGSCPDEAFTFPACF